MSDLPAPLSSPECDVRGMPYMALHVVRMFDSEFYALSTGDEFKAGVSLWAKAFLQVPAGSLPNNERLLAHYSGAGKDWSKVRDMAMHGWVLCSDDRYYHPTVVEVAQDAWQARTDNRARTEAARQARINKRNTGPTGNAAPPVTPNDADHDTEPVTRRVASSVTEPITETVTGSKGREGKRREEKKEERIPLASLARAFSPASSDDFEGFWEAYPRKAAKGAARKAWPRAIAKTTLDAMLRAISTQRWDADERYQPHAATWLNGERWLDQADAFDPVLRAAGLSPEDFDEANMPAGLLQ